MTYDDDNSSILLSSILLQVLSGEYVDIGILVQFLSYDDLDKMSGERKLLRLQFPGITALSYEMLNSYCS